MTLAEVIRTIEYVAHNQPSVNMIVRNDVFRINEAPQLRYGVFAWLQGSHSGSVDGNTRSYQFTFFYVDRLTDSKSNEIDVQSTGVQTLDNIIRTIDELGVFSDTSYTFQTFNQRFADECAGVFVNVSFTVPVGSLCYEALGDYNFDFNSDFLIF